MNRVCFQHFFEVSLSFSSPWSSSREHFIENDTNGPNIALEAVDIVTQGFIRHIDRRSNIVILSFFKVSAFDSKSKISDLNGLGGHENVGWFQIAMDDIVSVDGTIAVDNLPKDG